MDVQYWFAEVAWYCYQFRHLLLGAVFVFGFLTVLRLALLPPRND